MEILTNCPICNGTDHEPFLICKDYTVSRETFNIVNCKHCSFRFTNPRPVSDLGKYYESDKYISHSNTNKGIINRLYKVIRTYTLVKKLQLINRINGLTREKNILDIGCGTGEFLNVCKLGGWKTVGIEPSITASQQAISSYNLAVLPEEAIDTLSARSFNMITLWHVLEHVLDLNKRIEQVKRLIKEGGSIIIAVPNCSSKDAEYYKQYWAAYDVPRHLYHFTPKNIYDLCLIHNLTVVQVLPMRFDAFYVAMLSEKYKTGKLNLIRSLWIGFKSNISTIAKGNTFSSQIYILKIKG